MRRFFQLPLIVSAVLIVLALLPLGLTAQPCNLSDASGCDCDDGSSSCDLLPDINVAESLLLDASLNPEIPGELGVSVSTPNIGHGPLRVIATDYYVCDDDTVYSPGGFSGTCPDGSDPRQLIQQRIYQKNGGTMSYYDRWAGSMTYHASHGHMHVDDWGIYSLRLPVAGLGPLDWPVVAEGAKLGFCLMDYGSCNYYSGHCVDTSGAVLTNDAPNYGLGGGGYSCGLYNQGISAGWTDIYHHYLDGMQIPIPPTVCNGDYMLVVHVDPYNYFLEENDDNNVVAVPVTLTEQAGFTDFDINVEGGTTLCNGDVAQLSLPLFAMHYSWSTGDTTATIDVSTPGSYTCTVTTGCGTVTSNPLLIDVTIVDEPTTFGDTVYGAGSANLTASGSGELHWYDAESGGTLLGTGASFTTPMLTASTTYWVENVELTPGSDHDAGPVDHAGSDFSSNSYNGYLIFTAHESFRLESVKVTTDVGGNRTIELRDEGGYVLDDTTVFLPAGLHVVDLGFDINPGVNLQLGSNEAANMANFGFASPRFKRSDSGVSYPYDVPGVVSITDSRAGASFYYYFYDWKVSTPDFSCGSSREAADAVVEMGTGLDPAKGISGIELAPNPSEGPVDLRFTMPESRDLEIRIRDLAGRVVFSETLPAFSGTYANRIELGHAPAGIYLVELRTDGQAIHEKLVRY